MPVFSESFTTLVKSCGCFKIGYLPIGQFQMSSHDGRSWPLCDCRQNQMPRSASTGLLIIGRQHQFLVLHITQNDPGCPRDRWGVKGFSNVLALREVQ
jgi:hypothetical protein